MIRRDYPETVLEVVDQSMRFKPAALRAVRRFAESQPWRGSLDERKEKFLAVNRALAEAYEIAEPRPEIRQHRRQQQRRQATTSQRCIASSWSASSAS